MKSFNKYITEDIAEKFIDEFYEAIKDTHTITNIGEVKAFIPITSDNSLGKLITSGAQGDEPAGPMALLKWIKSNKVPSNVSFIPILSPESFSNKTHFDNDGRNVNLEIPNNPAREIKKLIQSVDFLKKISEGGYLSCQEDPKRDVAYLIIWKNNKNLVESFIKILKDNFKLQTNNGIRIGKDLKDNTTLGAYCTELGSSVSITIETPVKNIELKKRVDAQIKMIGDFVR